MYKKLALSAIIAMTANVALAGEFTLTSKDIKEGEMMSKAQEFQGFGCEGGNASPQLSWSGAPEGTKSFALTVHDRDAPTGSGWWHWQVINIPADTTSLATNAGAAENGKLPEGSAQTRNDYGYKGFGGLCPPPGHGVHHYTFTIHALKVEKLEIPEDASAALAGYMINGNSLGSASIEALYER
ncbi:YbhB/YbcL family Raf kinase inhibitor-like protein [Sessilibacter sp. MAH2]